MNKPSNNSWTPYLIASMICLLAAAASYSDDDDSPGTAEVTCMLNPTCATAYIAPASNLLSVQYNNGAQGLSPACQVGSTMLKYANDLSNNASPQTLSADQQAESQAYQTMFSQPGQSSCNGESLNCNDLDQLMDTNGTLSISVPTSGGLQYTQDLTQSQIKMVMGPCLQAAQTSMSQASTGSPGTPFIPPTSVVAGTAFDTATGTGTGTAQ
jgi:hypothetical protein